MRVIARMAEAVKLVAAEAAQKDGAPIAIGIGSPGPLNPVTGVVLSAPNLAGWTDIPLAKLMEKRAGLPAYIENDVNAGTYGEFKLGAGKGKRDVVGIFVGTGIGGGLILNGRLRSGFRHMAGELGHVVIAVDGPLCGCGKPGCLEALVSRTAIERDIRAAIQSGRSSIVTELAGPEMRLTSGVLAKAVEARDPVVSEVMDRVPYYLGIYVANMVNILDPEMVILGGGVMEAFGETFLGPIRETARRYFISAQDADKVAIVPAKLGDNAGVLGAAMLAWERHKAAKAKK